MNEIPIETIDTKLSIDQKPVAMLFKQEYTYPDEYSHKWLILPTVKQEGFDDTKYKEDCKIFSDLMVSSTLEADPYLWSNDINFQCECCLRHDPTTRNFGDQILLDDFRAKFMEVTNSTVENVTRTGNLCELCIIQLYNAQKFLKLCQLALITCSNPEENTCCCCLSKDDNIEEPLLDINDGQFTCDGEPIGLRAVYVDMVTLQIDTDNLKICDCCAVHLENLFTFRSLCRKVLLQHQKPQTNQRPTRKKGPIIIKNAYQTDNGLYKCKLCSDEFASRKRFRTHYKNQHENAGKFQCKVCLKQFIIKLELHKHQKEVHNDLRYHCEHCDKSYLDAWGLRSHIEAKHLNVTHQCRLCSKTFSSISSLNQHERKTHLKIRFDCKECNKPFVSAANLAIHVESVHQKIRFPCQQCEKSFSRPESLNKHIRAEHLKILLQCSRCDRGFAFETQLTNHIKRDHENIRYKCKLCARVYTRPSQLKCHERAVHLNIRHECKQCEKIYDLKHSLEYHVKKVHGNHGL